MLNFFKNNNGNTILLVLLILSGLLVVVLGMSNLVFSGLKTARVAGDSTKAYYSAEAGAERAIWEARNGEGFPELNRPSLYSKVLDNGAQYSVDFSREDPEVFYTSKGKYEKTQRIVEVGFLVSGSGEDTGGEECVSNCAGKDCGDDDECGGICDGFCPDGKVCVDGVCLDIGPACGEEVTFTYNGSVVIYGTVAGQNNTCWLDRNLGATQVAVSSTDSAAYGDLFQWGRPADGHQLINRTTGVPVNSTQFGQVATITPGTKTFIIPNTEWSSVDIDGALRSAYFAKADGTGICPSGFRVPTRAEWETERLSWSSNNAAGAFVSPLRLSIAGSRHYGTGSLLNVGSYGNYWSSTVDGAKSYYLYFASGNAVMYSYGRAEGFSVRCLRD